MKEYIERGAVLNKDEWVFVDDRMRHFIPYVAVELAPAADVVEVTRCKDCIHWYDREEVCLKIYSDGNVNANAWQERKPDDFCSYGKRRADHAE